MWSDECSFDMSRDITKWVIHIKKKCYHSACCKSVFKSNSIFISIWGVIDYNWKSFLMFLKEHEKREKITMKNYKTQILKTVVRSAFAEQLDWDIDELFQENNAPIHGAECAKSLQKWKKELSLHLFNWSSSFSDLFFIENVWWLLKQHIYCQWHSFQTHSDLIQAIKEKWDQLESKN